MRSFFFLFSSFSNWTERMKRKNVDICNTRKAQRVQKKKEKKTSCRWRSRIRKKTTIKVYNLVCGRARGYGKCKNLRIFAHLVHRNHIQKQITACFFSSLLDFKRFFCHYANHESIHSLVNSKQCLSFASTILFFAFVSSAMHRFNSHNLNVCTEANNHACPSLSKQWACWSFGKLFSLSIFVYSSDYITFIGVLIYQRLWRMGNQSLLWYRRLNLSVFDMCVWA